MYFIIWLLRQKDGRITKENMSYEIEIWSKNPLF